MTGDGDRLLGFQGKAIGPVAILRVTPEKPNGYRLDQVGTVEVTVEGPQGSGKTVLAALFRLVARAAGLRARIKEKQTP